MFGGFLDQWSQQQERKAEMRRAELRRAYANADTQSQLYRFQMPISERAAVILGEITAERAGKKSKARADALRRLYQKRVNGRDE